MTSRLILFDVDGTLVDSQASILAAMTAAFAAAALPMPTRAQVLGIVGLSLDRAMTVLAPDQPETVHRVLVDGYRSAYFEQRTAPGNTPAPFYPGAVEVLRHLAGAPHTVLGVATGKSRRGLDALIEAHGLDGMFATLQTADRHPSKPHPAMILAAMEETGIDGAATAMIGDTSFDMEMARAAGVAGIGVGWGYHPRDRLGAARLVIDRFGDLPAALERIAEGTA
jgi:phosphoglycolate phosphatase